MLSLSLALLLCNGDRMTREEAWTWWEKTGAINGVTYTFQSAEVADDKDTTISTGTTVAAMLADLENAIEANDAKFPAGGTTLRVRAANNSATNDTIVIPSLASGTYDISFSCTFTNVPIEADGTITLLGRGTNCINSGGEKIFPEEVETALRSHPGVFDVLVVGVPDERFGERVAAVVQARPGHTLTLEDLGLHARTKVSGYKVPRELHLVDEIMRQPSGKPDYKWAKSVATSGEALATGKGA